MLSDLNKIDWNFVYQLDNVNTIWRYISDNLRNVFDKHAHEIEKRVKGRPYPWINNKLSDCLNKCDQIL
jgi:hypothetical protein